jgi:hypothetical protein
LHARVIVSQAAKAVAELVIFVRLGAQALLNLRWTEADVVFAETGQDLLEHGKRHAFLGAQHGEPVLDSLYSLEDCHLVALIDNRDLAIADVPSYGNTPVSEDAGRVAAAGPNPPDPTKDHEAAGRFDPSALVMFIVLLDTSRPAATPFDAETLGPGK